MTMTRLSAQLATTLLPTRAVTLGLSLALAGALAPQIAWAQAAAPGAQTRPPAGTANGMGASATSCEVAALVGAAWLVEGSAQHPLKPGDKVGEGAQLRTGDSGRLRLRCPDGSSLVIGDRSQLTLSKLQMPAGQPREVSLLLQLGLLGQKVAPAGGGGSGGGASPGRWEVRTPSAVTAVRGTEFLVEVGADEQTAVHVQSGQVAVLPGERAAGSTRGLRLPIVVDKAGGTQCDVTQGCEAAKAWREDRVRGMLDRLAGV